MSLRAVVRGLLLSTAIVLCAGAATAQESARRVIAANEAVSSMTLVKSADGKAVVRFGASPLQVLAVGDRVGKTGATVTAIAAGRVVLDDVTSGADGKPLRAQIVIRDGQTGGRRFLRHPDLNAPVGTRPDVVEPATGNSAQKIPVPAR